MSEQRNTAEYEREPNSAMTPAEAAAIKQTLDEGESASYDSRCSHCDTRFEAWCSACGQPGATNGEHGAWHRYAVHMVECPDREAPWIWVGSSCDWGECDGPSVGIRFDLESSRYLPVCAQHFDGPGR